MKITEKLLVTLGLLPLLAILSVGSVSAQTDLGKTIQEKLKARVAKFESACARDIKKYCSTVTPGEGRLIYCMEAHEDKISVKCAFELEDAATNVQTAADALKERQCRARVESLRVCCRTNRVLRQAARKPFRKSNRWPRNDGSAALSRLRRLRDLH
jgi:hypothetical protein